MAGSSTILEDDSLISRIDRWFFKLEARLNLLGGLVIFLIVLLAVANILGRKFLGVPVDGYIDWTEQAMAFFAFMGIAYCQRQGGHIRMDIVVGLLKGRVLWFFEFVATLLMFVVTVLLVIGSYFHFLRAWTNGDSSFDINLPTWPAKLIVPIMLTLLAIRLFIHLWGYFRAFIRNDSEPVVVPLVESAAEQAANEAQAVADVEDDKEVAS